MSSGRVLVVGNGGREYALAWKLSQSPFVTSIYAAEGNAGTEKIANNVPIKPMDIYGLCSFAQQMKIDLTVVGPEFPLMLGIVDLFHAHSLSIFGPTMAASKIETSKAFAKKIMLEEGIVTAPFAVFDSYSDALQHIHERGFPLVIKADGLASGKGVYICINLTDAEIALKELMLDRIHGKSGDTVVIEDFLVTGKEISVHALCADNETIVFPPTRDYKRLKNANKGPNTGGMGAYGPLADVAPDMMLHVKHQIIEPVLHGLHKRGTPFTGCLYPGLMGKSVLEFNARFGDPEALVYMRLIEGDLYLLLKAFADNEQTMPTISFKNEYAVCVALCSAEYPLPINNPVPISGISGAEDISEKVVVFHGATRRTNGSIYTNGGRILYVSATGNTLSEACNLAYRAIEQIYFQEMQCRTDIANVS